MRYLILTLFTLFTATFSHAQSIRINEVVSSNSILTDEDGDTPDWIELYNDGSQNVNLENWTISDDEKDLSKWSFPSVTIPANDYLLIWASDKDRNQITSTRTLVNQGDLYKYLIPSSEPNTNWTRLNFNDSNWDNGASGFGYADGDDATVLPNGTLSVYLRKNFNISSVDEVISLILDIDYDDAFVAYINGIEVARANIIGVPPAFNASTNQDHEAQMYGGGLPNRFTISDFSSILVEGENVLAIQAHNISSGSSDFTIIPFLSAIFSEPNNLGVEPPEILNLNEKNTFHTNFKISKNAETLTLSDNLGNIIDQLLIEGLPPDVSIGVSNTSGNMVNYIETTPADQNADEEFLGTVQNELVFSENGGFKDAPVNLSLSGNDFSQLIRYTTDGSAPNALSQIYTSPIQISTNLSVRAQIYSDNYLPSLVFTESYIFGSNHEIDVLLLSVDPIDFFDEDSGIYVFGPEGTFDSSAPYFGANFWEDWERPVHFSFHEKDRVESVEFNAGVKIFGGWSRGQNSQRSLSFFARGQYGDSKFEHSFFDNVAYNDFEAFTLRNSGQDWMRSSMKDIMITSLMRGSDLDFQDHNPVATYINGTYWGMYNMREKINEHMLASKHNVDAESITLLTNNAEVIEGSNDEYNELIAYIENTDLSEDSNFEFIKDRIDLKNYTLYQATNIFINNQDWPGNNIKFWKHPDTKWRWIMYDTDFGFGPFWNISNHYDNTLSFALNPNGPGWPNPPWSTLLFRKLIANNGFRNQFINRYADELNTRFLPNNVINHIDQIYSTIEPEVLTHYTRWKDDPLLGYELTDINAHVDYYVTNMKSFGTNRHPIAKEHIKQQFNLPNYHPLTITNPDINQGFVEVNENLNIQDEIWTGDYFETVPVKLMATAAFGYEFSHWSGDLYSIDETIEVLLTESFEVIPNFTPTETIFPVVINEINYKSVATFDADDWIELYNPNTSSIDVSNWQIKDDDNTHVFVIPDGTKIDAEGYLVIVKKETDFRSVLPGIPYVGELNFGYGGSDAVRLYNQNGTLQDIVDYQSVNPWPICADETGYTLELVSPDLDNDLPESWACINVNGSPNAANDKGFDQLSPTRQMIAIPNGWSMFSTYMIAEDMDLASVISPIVDDVIIIKDFNGTAYLKEWNFNGVGDLQVGHGYQIKTTTEASLEIFGNYAFPEAYPITLRPGWNLIAYLKLEPSDAVSVFSDINQRGNLLIVKDYKGSAYLPELGFNGIGKMHSGQGYQLKIINEDVLKYLPND
jgi:hypothetical protein